MALLAVREKPRRVKNRVIKAIAAVAALLSFFSFFLSYPLPVSPEILSRELRGFYVSRRVVAHVHQLRAGYRFVSCERVMCTRK